MAGLSFNMLLAANGITSARVRLLRHQEVGSAGTTPYILWRDRPDQFEVYQALQRQDRENYFKADYWASFVVPPDGSSLFVGLYRVCSMSPATPDMINPLTGQQLTNPHNHYELDRVKDLQAMSGRLKLDWGQGARSWVQRADSPTGDKPIIELTQEFSEPVFPGYTKFVKLLSELSGLPSGWISALRASRGIYLLTCPKTKEQYVGSASGEDGFWGRWLAYAMNGHGGNVGLMAKDPSDYQISILEVAGSTASSQEILLMEALWKKKLQSREMGLNHN